MQKSFKQILLQSRKKYKVFSKNGATLIEVLVASLILLIGVGTSLWLMVENRKIINQNNKYLVANSLASDYFEELYARRTKNDVVAFLNQALSSSGHVVEIKKSVEGSIRDSISFQKFTLKVDTATIVTAPGFWGGLGSGTPTARPAVLRVDLKVSFDKSSLDYTTFSRNLE